MINSTYPSKDVQILEDEMPIPRGTDDDEKCVNYSGGMSKLFKIQWNLGTSEIKRVVFQITFIQCASICTIKKRCQH